MSCGRCTLHLRQQTLQMNAFDWQIRFLSAGNRVSDNENQLRLFVTHHSHKDDILLLRYST